MSPLPSSAALGAELWLDDLRVFARCPLEWFWERRAGMPRPRSIASLLPQALKMALAFYYESHAERLIEAVHLVWRDWCEAWGEVKVVEELDEYARGRSGILGLFEKGYLAPPGGGRYKAPRMTTQYKQRMHRAGLTRLGRRLDDFARSRGLKLPDAAADQPGSLLGDVYADCLEAGENVSRYAKLPLPARAVVLGWQVPYRVDFGQGVHVAGEADLVIQAPPDAGRESVIMEVHEFLPVAGLRTSMAARDLRVIGASLALPSERSLGHEQRSLSWQQVSQVVYRHWPTGEAFEFRETNSGHLRAVLSAVVRGMSGNVIIPRALTGYDDCRECAYREQCWDAGWEALPLVDPGTLGLAEQLRDFTREVRVKIGSDGAAARHALEALEVIQSALARVLPDSFAAVAWLNEARHQLETSHREG